MTSFLSRIANEATAALSDAYGHVMHGDDAGASARIVWVVHPCKVPVDKSAGTVVGGGSNNNRLGEGKSAVEQLALAKGAAAMSISRTKDPRDVSSPGGGGGALSSYLFTQKFGECVKYIFYWVHIVCSVHLAELACLVPL